MLTIYDWQFRNFDAALLPGYLPVVIASVREADLPEVDGWSDDLLEARVRHACARGVALGADTDVALEPFVFLMMAYGPAFDRHPDVEAILHRRDYAFEDRIELLYDRLPGHVWAELTLLSGEAAWHAAGAF